MMKLTVRPLKGEQFVVEYDAECKVENLKEKIAALKPEFPAEQQKLIYSGKILVNESPVKEYGIKDGEFVVVMVAKAKPPPGAPAAEPAAAPAAAPAPAAAAPAPASDAPVAMDTASSNLVTGSHLEPAIAQLCEMGFERPQVERCLQAAFNNPDRAVDYLMNGIPDSVTAAQAPPAAPAQTTPGADGGAAMQGAGGDAGADEGLAMLQDLASDPEFAQVAAMIQAHPQMIQELLPQLQQTHPGLVQAIGNNPEAFQRILQQAAAAGMQDGMDPVAAMMAAGQAAGGGGAPGGGAPQQQNVVRLTEQEAEAVHRLTELGFDRNMAAQAYLACDKNEELAANLLFNSMQD